MRFWRSPSDQPSWARPVLLGVACLAGLAYAWGSDNANLEPFYGGAARSMSNSWHDFLFGAFDPAGTVTVDKLPGALWLQALSLRILGFRVWAVVLPQILEGVATILVLYRAVRRLVGPVAGITAAITWIRTHCAPTKQPEQNTRVQKYARGHGGRNLRGRGRRWTNQRTRSPADAPKPTLW
jgi:hypothetical protein